MAYIMSQERKKQIQQNIKPVLEKYGIKATMSVSNDSTLKLNIKSGKIDFISSHNKKSRFGNLIERHGYMDVYFLDFYYGNTPKFTGEAQEFLAEAMKIISDIKGDYYNAAWYSMISIGKYEKPYIVTKA